MVFWSGFIKKIKNAVTKERVDKLEQKINTNATNIELIEQDVEGNTTSIDTIKNNITSINSSINNIDNEVTRLENSLTTTNNELDSLEANVNGFDARITEANTKATNAEEQATRLGLTVSSNSTKIVTLETKTNDNRTNISSMADRINEHTNVLNGILRIKKMTINFSQIRLIQEIDKGNGTRFQNYNYELPISYSRVVAVVPIINGGTSPEKMICSPKVFTNNWIELSCVHYDTRTRFNIGGHFTILYI